MSLPKGACPIVYTCKQAYEQARRSMMEGLFDDALLNDSGWDVLGQMVHSSGLCGSTTRLRGLYVVELLYHELVPRLIHHMQSEPISGQFTDARFDRTIEGLDRRLEMVLDQKRYYSARSVMHALAGTGPISVANHAKTAESFKGLEDSCRVMLICLRQGSCNGISTLGTCLAQEFIRIGLPYTEAAEILLSVLRVNKENPIYPWQR